MAVFDVALLAEWAGGKWTVVPNSVATGFCFDSRKLKPGEVFLALRSEKSDGHAYVLGALKNGATGAIVENGGIEKYGLDSSLPLLVVDDVLAAFRRIARHWRREVAPKIIGITGSVGKSTVKEWTTTLIGGAGKVASTIANFNNDIGLPYSLLSMEEGSEYGIFEAGISHVGDMDSLAETMEPDAAIITAIKPVHIEFFSSLAGIADEKAKLFSGLPECGFVVLDADGEFFDYLSKKAPCRVVGVSVAGVGDVPSKKGQYVARIVHEGRGEFILEGPGLEGGRNVVLGKAGRHNVLDALLAIAAAHNIGVSWEIIMERISGLQTVEMRFEFFEKACVRWINDAYNASPASMEASINGFTLLYNGKGNEKRVFVLGDMFELGTGGPGYHREVGQYLAGLETNEKDILICVGELAKGFAAYGFNGEVFYAIDGYDAARLLHRIPDLKERVVLLKASHGMHLERVPDFFEFPIKELSRECPLVVVLGSGRSGNSAKSLLEARGAKVDVVEKDGEIPWRDYVLAVVSPGVPSDHAWMDVCKRRNIKVISEMELGAAFFRGRTIAVTGSKGKSSVVKLLADAINDSGLMAVPCGNYGLPLCEVVNSSPHADWAIVEASSFQLELLENFRPDISIFLNLQSDHLDRHGSMAGYAGAKAKLYSRFVKEADLAIVENDALASLEELAPDVLSSLGSGIVQYGFATAFGVSAKGLGEIAVSGYFESDVVRSGAFMACLALKKVGIDDALIENAISKFKPLPHRMEIVGEIGGVVCIDNSKATSLAALAASLKMAGRPSHLIAGGRLKETDLDLVKETVAKYARRVYLIGESQEDFYRAWHDSVEVVKLGTMDRAVDEAFKAAKDGEAILLAPGCASFDQFSSYGERGEAFKKLVNDRV